MTRFGEKPSEDYEFEPEALMVPPMEGILRRLFGARWGVVLVSGAEGVKLEPILDFLANYSLRLAFYSEFPAEKLDFENLEREPRRIRTIEEVIEEAKEALGSEEDVVSGGGVVRHVPRNPEVVFVKRLEDHPIVDVMRIALSGRLAFCGMEAEGSFVALRSFVDLVGNRQLVAAGLMGILAFSTVARICPRCRVRIDYELQDDEAFLLGVGDAKLTGYRGFGCEDCGSSGYAGRILISEGLELDEKLRTAVLKNVPLRTIRLNAKASGMSTLLDAAWALAGGGETTLDEVMRIAEATDPGR